jgi:hypothetical protein
MQDEVSALLSAMPPGGYLLYLNAHVAHVIFIAVKISNTEPIKHVAIYRLANGYSLRRVSEIDSDDCFIPPNLIDACCWYICCSDFVDSQENLENLPIDLLDRMLNAQSLFFLWGLKRIPKKQRSRVMVVNRDYIAPTLYDLLKHHGHELNLKHAVCIPTMARTSSSTDLCFTPHVLSSNRTAEIA